MLKVVLVHLLILFVAGCTKSSTAEVTKKHTSQAQVQKNEQEFLLESEKNTISVFDTVSPLVVYVHKILYYRRNFSFETTAVPAGEGSGFLWGQDGYVVTNYHVVENADNIAVTFSNGKTKNAKLIGVDRRKDIAVLKVELEKPIAEPLQVADSSKLQVGQKTLAIGNPYGLAQSLSTGVISALGRSVPGIGGVKIREMIQTDAAVNRGNSGGPLLDSRGYLIGMNTQIVSSSGDSAGIGFAVPANTIKRVVGQIIKHGRVIQPELGITILHDQLAFRLGIEGIVIQQVLPGSDAAKKGLRGLYRDDYGRVLIGDVITAIDGKKVRTLDDLYVVLEKHKAGDYVEVTYLRDGKKLKAKILLKVYSS